nr:hypothetical protein [Evansella caseinilytica]
MQSNFCSSSYRFGGNLKALPIHASMGGQLLRRMLFRREASF